MASIDKIYSGVTTHSLQGEHVGSPLHLKIMA